MSYEHGARCTERTIELEAEVEVLKKSLAHLRKFVFDCECGTISMSWGEVSYPSGIAAEARPVGRCFGCAINTRRSP